MIKAIVWKELREQGLIALTLVVLGAGVLAATAALADPPADNASPTDVVRYLGAGRLATLMLAVTAGIVCGGAVFAAEREAGTFGFLDSLPSTRWSLWQAKLIAGLGLSAGQIVLLVVVAAALGLVPTVGWAVAVFLYALLAFVWGMFGSTTARTTLGSVGVAIPAASLTSFFALVPVVLFFQHPGAAVPRPTGGLIFFTCMFTVPLILSAWLFTQLDRSRSADDAPVRAPVYAAGGFGATVSEPAPATRRPRVGTTALLWLSGRQLLILGLVLSAFAILFGLALLAPGVQPFATWPALALTAGVLAGVTAFADEQTRGAARFWGEQRLPLGRLWTVKIGIHLLFCLWLLVLLAAPLAIRVQFEDAGRTARGHTLLAAVFHAPLFDELGRQGWKFLVVPAAYGFAAGHLCGLLFRKLVVACGVAAIVGGVGAGLWLPSLLAGGVLHWQLWLPVIVALLTGRLLLRAWAADRTGTRGALTTLAGGCAAVVVVLAAGIGYRILEIPDQPGGEDDIAYVASLPTLEHNSTGRDFRTAAEQYARLAAVVSAGIDGPDRPAIGGSRLPRVEERLEQVPRFGWKTNDVDLELWLDRVFADAPPGAEIPWHVNAVVAANKPTGIYENPQLVGMAGFPSLTLDNSRRMAVALLARGLERQAAGDSADFLARARTTLALAATMRNGSIMAAYSVGSEIERLTLGAFDMWLQNLTAQNVLRPAIDLLAAAAPRGGFDPTPHFLAERHVIREGMKSPSQWLPALITPHDGNPDATATEVDLVGVAWAVPWERERTRRLVNSGFESGFVNGLSILAGRPGAALLVGRTRNPIDMVDYERQLSGLRRTALLKLALRAHRAEHGKYPDSLPDLVAAGYLRELPADPYDEDRAFGYRIAKRGETLTMMPRMMDRAPAGIGKISGQPDPLIVPAGQAILWSVGPDKTDQGGTYAPAGINIGPNRPPDIVYLVPIGLER